MQINNNLLNLNNFPVTKSLVKKEFSLPQVIVEMIFKYLNVRDLSNMAGVNRSFRKLSLDDKDYLYFLQKILLQNCVTFGVRQERVIKEVDCKLECDFKHTQERLTKELEESHRVNIIEDSPPVVLLKGTIECISRRDEANVRKKLTFEISSCGKIKLYDPTENTFYHQVHISEIDRNFNRIYSAQQIGNVVFVKVKYPFEGRNKYLSSMYLDLDKYIEPWLYPENSKVLSNFECSFKPKMLPFSEETWNISSLNGEFPNYDKLPYYKADILITYSKTRVCLFEITHSMEFNGLKSYPPFKTGEIKNNKNNTYISQRLFIFPGRMHDKPGPHLLYAKRFCDDSWEILVLPKLSLIGLYNQIAIVKESFNTIVFLYRSNLQDLRLIGLLKAPETNKIIVNGKIKGEDRGYPDFVVLSKEIMETDKVSRLSVDGEIKNVSINYDRPSDQLIVKVIYKKAATKFRRAILKELTLSSKQLRPIVPIQEKKSWFKIGCGSTSTK